MPLQTSPPNFTRSELQEALDYDPETGQFFWKERRGSAVAGQQAGCLSVNGCRVIRFGKKLHTAHRLAWLYVHGEWPQEIDHRNGDPSDNRIANLRPCSHAENTRNVKMHRDTASGMKGVYRDKKKWVSRIYVAGKDHFLGTFATREEAAAAYDEAARELHGEFARLSVET
jgi:hypothetical protein